MPFDDDAEADHPGFRPPPHPDDRLWRHPSEMSAHPIVPLRAPARRPGQGSRTATDGDRRAGRRWGALVAAGAVGGVLAGAGVMALGRGERVVERPVTERVALGSTDEALGEPGTGDIDGVRRHVAPAVVGIAASGVLPGGAATSGTGVVVRDDGIVVTSAALVPRGAAPRVRLPDGTDATSEVVGTDATTGLAVLDLAGDGYTPSVLATGDDLAPGAASFAVSARPSGGTATGTGVVGTAERYLGPAGGALDGVEIEGDADALAIGGPVVDEAGAVLGITTAVEDGGAWYIAPIGVARRVIDDLLSDGVAHHCRLGIEGTDVAAGTSRDGGSDSTAAATLAEGDAGSTSGTLVASVVPDSPAALGGVRAGDVVVALDQHEVTRMADLIVGLRAHSPGDRVDVTVVRPDGARVTLVLRLDEAPTPAPAA